MSAVVLWDTMHPRLGEKLRRHFGADPLRLAEPVQAFVEELDAAFHAHDLELEELRRSLGTAGAELDEVKRETAAMVKAIPDLVIVTDGEGNILSWHGERLPSSMPRSGGEPASGIEPTSANLVDRLPVEIGPRVAQAVLQLPPGGQKHIEYTIDRADQERHFEASLHRLPNADEVSILIRDVSERVTEATARLQRIDQEARAEAMLELGYAASHDLRAPLRHIKSLADWLVEDIGDDVGEDARANLGLLRASVTKMDELLSALLEYARVGQADVTIEPLDLRESIIGVVDMLGTERFDITVADDMPTIVTARSPFERVILNLVANALKHHDKDRGSIVIGGKWLGEHYQITVADDGPGIAETKHVEAFKMFRKLSTRGKHEGSGMGLALIKKIVEHAGGQITLSPNRPRGCAFRFTWPKRWGSPSAQERPEETPSRRVLVVDDSALARDLTRRMLTRRGFHVIEASSAKIALATLRAQPIDVVLTDLNMPRMDGFSFIERVRSDPRLSALPVFVLSSEPGKSYAEHARRVGANGYLVKPVRATVLAQSIQAALEKAATVAT